MRLRSVISVATSVCMFAVAFDSVGFCQAPIGQTVQLPTTGNFGVNTTVMVPDGGIGYLGGNSRYASGTVVSGAPGASLLPGANRGFRNVALGESGGRSFATVKTTVIVMSELEDELMNGAKDRLWNGMTYSTGGAPSITRIGLEQQSVSKSAFLKSPTSAAAMAGESAFRSDTKDRSAFSLVEPSGARRLQPSARPDHGSSSRSVRRAVNPDGSAETQRKADFISRNIGKNGG